MQLAIMFYLFQMIHIGHFQIFMLAKLFARFMGLFFKIHFISDFESFYSAKLFSFPNFIISFHQLIIFFSYCFFKMGFFGEVVFCKKDHFQLNLMEICLGPAIFFF